MFILGIFLEVTFACAVLCWLQKNANASAYHISAAITAKREFLQAIEDRLQYTQEFNAKIANSVNVEAASYEITRELSKTVDEAKILDTFREKISAIFNLDGCTFFDVQPQAHDSTYSFFRVVVGQKIKFFAVQSSEKIERAKILVMLNQLELFLKRAKLYSEIQEIAITDGLTGVYVRRYFMERLKEEQIRSKQNSFDLALLLIDVDNFKAYNDTYGHVVGDAVLREIARIVKLSLRQIDMCARYGGEEFCIMLPETTKEKAFLAAERIRLNVGNCRIKVFNENLSCTISIGISSYPEDAEQITNLIDKADKALYVAKAKGRNRICAFGIKC